MHWKKGPEWWLRISYLVFFGLLLTNYVILPLINIGISIFYIVWPGIDLEAQSIESYVIFITIVCFSRLVEYVFLIRRTVVLDARIYLQTKEEMEN